MISEPIRHFLGERIAANDFPSASFFVAENAVERLSGALGLAVAEPERIDASSDTIYDVASLTKPLVTGLLLAILLERGEVDLSDAAARYLPQFAAGLIRDTTIRLLATHTSGLPAWLPLYVVANSPASVIDLIANCDRSAADEKVIYSDLNFLTLQAVIESILGVSIDTAARTVIFEPLRLTSTAFNPLRYFPDKRFAASERGNRYERETCEQMGFLEKGEGAAMFRDYVIRGEVHDGNAWFLGGAAGHAGLFSTAAEVSRIALQFLPAHSVLLKPETTELFRTDLTPGLTEARSLAFQLASTPESTAGRLLSPQSFGHLGFTGTSVWVDPALDRVFVLLTNRTHNHDLPFVNINSVRRRFHDLAVEALKNRSN